MIDWIPIEQAFPRPLIEDVEAACSAQAERLCADIVPESQIAIAVGSRGMANLQIVVSAVAAGVRARGASPFIVPAMGSHGGATAKGQAELLAGYGINETALGVPVRATMDTVELPGQDLPVPVCVDRLAAAADGTILINRVKPHTSFHARYESGLVKMAAIGLGKQRQASAIHALGLDGLREVMPAVGMAVLASGHVIGGMAVVENAYDETMCVEGLRADEIAQREPELLELAKANMPRLPLGTMDLLVVDRIGKDISGLGMDPNVIGRLGLPGLPDPGCPAIRVIIATDLTEATHGNALGIGLADITTRRLVDRIDYAAMYANALTTTFTSRAKIPLIAATDEQALDYACRICGKSPSDIIALRIPDTLHLSRLLASPAAARAYSRSSVLPVNGLA